jgi:FkbM family methyltransferase
MKLSISTVRNWLYRLKHYGLRNTWVLMRHLKKDGLFALRYSGNCYYLRGNTVDFAVFNSIFAKGEYDFTVSFTPEVIVDAGAFTGISSRYFHERYPGALVIAVEPERSNFDLLERNTNSFEKIQCVRGGIYGEETRLVIKDPDAEKYAFRVESSQDDAGSVAGYTIASLMKLFDITCIDILKLDIEGAEYSVFSHETDSWLPLVRALVVELHEYINPGVTETVLKILKERGFNTTWKGENLIAYRDTDTMVI